MAQNFKSKDLTISIPEKGEKPGVGTGCTCNTNIQFTDAANMPTPTACGCTNITNPCLGFTNCGFTPHYTYTLCHGYSPIISPGTCTTSYHFTPTACTLTYHCTPSACTVSVDPPGNISDVTDVDTLTALKEKLASALKEVEAQHAALSKK